MVAAAANDQEACCTCTALLSAVPRPPPPRFCPETEKPLPTVDDRRLSCCSRIICAACLIQNHRYLSYCPYCQLPSSSSSSSSSSNPPPYHDKQGPAEEEPPPPPYASLRGATATDENMAPSGPEKAGVAAAAAEEEKQRGEDDTLHFLDHDRDSVASLGLRYGVPAEVLRRANALSSDHLLFARRTLLIPGSHYRGGISLSPRPVETEAEEARKAKIRRFMVACKVHEYDVAVFYLAQADYDLPSAVETFLADEAWERENPAAAKRAAAVTPRREWFSWNPF